MSRIHLVRSRPLPTATEQKLCDALRLRGVEVYQQYFDKHKHIDLVLPQAKIDLEIDGLPHLTDPHQIVADLARGYFSHRHRGYDTMHIPNEMVIRHLEQISDGLAAAVLIRKERLSPKPILVQIGEALIKAVAHS